LAVRKKGERIRARGRKEEMGERRLSVCERERRDEDQFDMIIIALL